MAPFEFLKRKKPKNKDFFVQNSTKTLIPSLAKSHYYLSARSGWYYRWHLKPYAKIVHWLLLILTIITLFAIIFGTLFIYPKATQAATLTIRPEAAGDTTQWTLSGCSTNWDCIDEDPHDSDTTYVYSVTTGAPRQDLYNLQDTSQTGAISGIAVYFVAAGADFATPPSVGAIIKEGGTTTEGAQQDITNSYATYSQTWSTNPRTSAAWQWSEINSLQAGIKDNARGYEATAKITQLYVVVNYTTYTQAHYRFRDDTFALNTDGGWLAEEDTAISNVPKNTVRRLRVAIYNDGDSANQDFKLQWRLSGGSWADLASTGDVKWALSDQYAASAATTAALLTEQGSSIWVNGSGQENAIFTSTITFGDGKRHTEFEWAWQFDDSASGTYEFRVVKSDGTAIDTYLVTPTATVMTPPPPPAPPPPQPSPPPPPPPPPPPEIPPEIPPEVPPETPPEIPPEIPPEVPPETPPEIPPEIPPEVPPETPPEIPPEIPPEVPPETPPPLIGKIPRDIQKIIQPVKEFVESPTGSKITKTVSTVGLAIGGAAIASGFLFFPTSFAEGFLLLLRLLGAIMTAFGLKKRVRPWGTAYDSITKQPLDPAYVVLQGLDGKEIASSITDLDGRYGFLVSPGRYKIIAQKTNYKFPSEKLFGKTHDELYTDLYFGEEIEIKKVGEVITKNIPLDPEKFDWNEFAKRKKNLLKFYSQADLFLRRLSNLLFVFGFFASVIAVIFIPYPYNLVILILYLFLLILRLLGLKPKTYGSILEKQTGFPLSFAIVRVFAAELEKEMFCRVADKFGRYYILVPKGKYYLKIEKKNEDGSYSHIFFSGIINAQKGIIQKRFIV